MLYFLILSSGSMPLTLDKHYFFGRGEGNNITVDDLRASRRHAELYWDGSAFVVMDLNSSNGTFVNSERMASSVLKDKDVIQIGLQRYVFRAVESEDELNESVRELTRQAKHMQTAEMPALNEMLPDTDFNGTLSTMSATEICQMLQMGLRNGMLSLKDNDGRVAVLYLERGRIIGAECGDLAGDDAVYQALGFMKGTFSFRTDVMIPKRNVKGDTTSILLDAARKKDEKKNSGFGPPPLLPE